MDRLLVGRVGRPHGVRGELKVIPETDDPGRFDALETVFVGKTEADAVPYAVSAVRFQDSQRGVTVVLKLDGVASREAAAALRQQSVFADREDLPPLAEDEVFLHDLVGLAVVTEAGEPVGTVVDILQMPAHDVYVVARDGRDDVLIPAVPAFVADVDLDARRLVIRPIEGLLE